MKDQLKRYFTLLEEKDLLPAILHNEYKHLSGEYRSNRDKMADLLHTDFYEKGKSGTVYNKQAILDIMPLELLECHITEFSYNIEDDALVCTYVLNENGVLMTCTSIWMFEGEKLRLQQFRSAYINNMEETV